MDQDHNVLPKDLEVRLQLPPRAKICRLVCTSLNNLPPRYPVSRALILFNNVTLAAPGLLWIMLGRDVAVPQYIGAAGFTGNILAVQGSSATLIEDFSASQSLTGGAIHLVTLEYQPAS